MQLDPHQLYAAHHPGRSVRCEAAPGSGKTAVIVERVRWLMSSGYHHNEILLLTFTRKAAAEMRRRIEATGLRAPEIRTFHGWAAHWLRAYADTVGMSPYFSIYDQTDTDDLTVYAGKELGLKWKSTERLGKEPTVVQAVDRLLREANAVSYSSLEVLFQRVLERNPTLCGRWLHVLVDEAQDTSREQQSLLRHLRPRSLFLVGDPGQSIYAFRGADVGGFRAMGEEVCSLPTNYRSSGRIVHLVSALAEGMDPPGLSQIAAEGAEVGRVTGSDSALILGLAAGAGTTAILAPTWRPLEELAKQIPGAVLARPVAAIWDCDEMRTLIAGLRVTANPDDHVSLLRWMSELCPVSRLEWAQFRAVVLAGLGRTLDVGRAWFPLAAPQADSAELLTVQLARTWRRAHLATRADTVEICAAAIQAESERQGWEGPADLLSWYGSRHVQGDETEREQDGIVLSTVHAAKGLEWDRVILLCDGRWVGSSPQEQLRLAYVGCSRARKELVIANSEAAPGEMGLKILQFVWSTL